MPQRIQHIITNLDGVVKKTNQKIFLIDIGSMLSEIHPFFYNINLLSDNEKPIIYNCVNLDLPKEVIIVDIEILKKKETLSILVHDLTSFYNDYQSIAQEKNELNLYAEKADAKNFALLERENFKNLFIQHFSHEIRNPLMHMVSFAELLSSTTLDQQQKDFVDYIKQSGKRLDTMLADILNLGKINSGQQLIKNEPFNIINLLKSLELVYLIKSREKGLKFSVTVEANIPEIVISDEQSLFQILSNLLNNALKYTNEGEVSLKVSLNHKWGKKVNLSFQVFDTGIGIAKEELPKIFESFSRLGNANYVSGFGIGLYIVKKLLVALESEIKVTKNAEKGSIFYFDLSLNCVQKSTIEAPLQENKIKKNTKLFSKKKKKRIIIVDDDEKTQMILFKYLLEEGRFIIDAFSGKENIIKMVIDTPYDCILMDINLPNVNGHELTKVIRELPVKKISSVPIIGITANAFKNDIEKYKSYGINTVLTKPFTKDALIQVIDKYC